MSILDGLRERLQPPLRLPFEGVLTPQGLAGVTRTEIRPYDRTLGHKDLFQDSPVDTTDRFGEREDAIYLGPDSCAASSASCH